MIQPVKPANNAGTINGNATSNARNPTAASVAPISSFCASPTTGTITK
ncbi:MAG: hypothetical protein IPJ19_18800 [Planctomycetes bacterium]|nr:hypothetical protein [Planctomycetota bacterium]